MEEGRTVELFSKVETARSLLASLKSVDGSYYFPKFAEDTEEDILAYVDAIHSLRSKPERMMPMIVMDSGFMLDHPCLDGFVVKSFDFTGEGIQDEHGHGTIVALQLLRASVRNHDKEKPRLFSVKVIGSNGFGKEKHLVEAFNFLRDERKNIPFREQWWVVNLSLGVYSRKFGLFECKGDCKVCTAAAEASMAGIMIMAAGGDVPNVMPCPARARMAHPNANIISVGLEGDWGPDAGKNRKPYPPPEFVKIPGYPPSTSA